MEELTCPHCGFFADSDSFEEVNWVPFEPQSESGKEYRKYECPNCGERFFVAD